MEPLVAEKLTVVPSWTVLPPASVTTAVIVVCPPWDKRSPAGRDLLRIMLVGEPDVTSPPESSDPEVGVVPGESDPPPLDPHAWREKRKERRISKWTK